jgi:hypothetical protein
MREFKFWVEDVSNDESEFQLLFTLDGKLKGVKTEYSYDDCLIDCYEFWRENCEKYSFDGRIDRMIVEFNFRMGM